MNLEKSRLRNKNLFKILFLFIFVATFTFLALKLPKETSATRGEFKAGNIISDYMMSKFDTMSVAEIQAFLNEKGNCNNTDTYMASWYPSVHYHIEGGRYVCLANERFATSGTNYGDLLSDGEASQTAAEIIYEVAHEYEINPQVLLVLLEKEQGLISDSWPNSLQYRSATGYGCPDTAACDSKYYGFKNQLKNAAGLFRTVLNGGWTNYPIGENWIYYNPNYDCGGSTVNVENLATSALYRYTPYQPNAAALSVGYGTAYCGAYGNRNFSYLFWDWFGDPTATIDVVKVDDILKKISSKNFSGTYNILSSADNNKALSIANASNSDGANIQTATYSNTLVQQWEISQSGDYYVITNKATGKVIDIANGIYSNNTNIWQYGINKSCAQRWLFVENSDSTVSIHNACYPQYVLDLQDGRTNVQIYSKTNYDNSNQKWELKTANSKDG